jgi:hypothetical protein
MEKPVPLVVMAVESMRPWLVAGQPRRQGIGGQSQTIAITMNVTATARANAAITY